MAPRISVAASTVRGASNVTDGRTCAPVATPECSAEAVIAPAAAVTCRIVAQPATTATGEDASSAQLDPLAEPPVGGWGRATM